MAGGEVVTGEPLVKYWQSNLGPQHPHPRLRFCPACGADLMTVGLTKLAYTFEACECGTPEYGHLVEQLWHRGRLQKP